MQTFATERLEWPATARDLRRRVRELVAAHGVHDPVARANCWARPDPEFSRKLAAEGFIGMIWPKEYGGHERTALERYVVLEELLAMGAPVGAHWIADRQTGSLLLRYGSEEAKRRWVPGMARGEVVVSIGLSEPNAGSDLA
ncbi:MAG: acyl-CoA dehydrogenase family protein, partial [Novosphingobium sp.]|nr:acyl-CoA dehydrogenase family protein [Novosphingobium sp.]